ncbi:MAG: hypothetical protein LUG83_05300 [Lachnospiraceae bacterium]|nr:hypothetical protein [Lachnospiraceae bacterium]
MVVSIIGAIIGALIAAFGLYYLFKEWKDPESKKIYGIISGIGGVIFIAMFIKLLVELM